MSERDPSSPPSWHSLSVEQVGALLSSSVIEGLAPDEASARLRHYGPNAITERRRRHAGLILLSQFSDFMVLVLATAAILAGVIGEPQDTVAIVAILVLNAVLGFVQEYRAERALESLRAISVAAVRVRRGKMTTVVPGTAAGSRGRWYCWRPGIWSPPISGLPRPPTSGSRKRRSPANRTPIDKITDALADPDLVLGDRRNMAYKGTSIVHGRGAGLVVASGMKTELGRIASLLVQERGVRTPLQIRLTRLGQRLAGAALAVCALVLLLGLVRGERLLPMLLTAISLAVAAIPEALPAVVTVALALGARRMIREHALVRQLPAVETLGSVTVICVDKTGTLTENRMQVEGFVVNEVASGPPPESARPDPWPRLLEALALSNDVHLTPDGKPLGDPTEIALFQAAAGAGCDPAAAAQRSPRLAELPFTAERACMTTLHRSGSGVVAYTKGSHERVLSICVDRLGAKGAETLNTRALMQQAEDMAEKGLRVMALAYRRFSAVPDPLTPETVEVGQTFLGLVGLLDPPRPEAAEAVATCRAAGVTVVMITGDHPATARNVAARLSILDHGKEVLTGSQLERLTPEALIRRVETVRVYARVAPEQKIAIIRALQARGECVAMTGDGINDAPALRRADIGIAMGRGGTDVAREAAHLVLLDDNFATIVSAVRAGRRIYDNIRKFVRYVVTCNAAEVETLLLAPLIALPVPLLPIHLLWINLVTDGLPGIALAVEPAEPDVMRRGPRAPGESIFAGGLWQHVVWVGLVMAGVTLTIQAWAYHHEMAHWQTMTFTVLALSQMGHVLAIRSERTSLFRAGIGSNLPLLAAVALTVLLQLGTIYLPGAGAVFKTQPLSPGELLICLLLSTVVFFAVEGEKWLIRRGVLYRGTVGGRLDR